MNQVIEASHLSKKYRSKFALSDCNISIPKGHVVGLVGPNGAGKTTLIQIAVGLISTYDGEIQVLGGSPGKDSEHISKVGFVAQDSPLYNQYTVGDHLNFGKWLNPNWDQESALARIERLDLNMKQKVGSLSGGERAQLALTIAVSKRPELLILDEPVASLDPLARRTFLQFLMEDVASNGISVLMSSHLVSDLERVCDYLIVLVSSRVQLAAPVDELLLNHKRLICKRRSASELPNNVEVIEQSHTDTQSSFIAKVNGQIWNREIEEENIGLEDLVLAYMSTDKANLSSSKVRNLQRKK